jgi:hypothetical protein
MAVVHETQHEAILVQLCGSDNELHLTFSIQPFK